MSLEQLQTGKPIFIALKNKTNGAFVEDVQKRTKNVIETLLVATVKISDLKIPLNRGSEGAPTAPMAFVLLVSTCQARQNVSKVGGAISVRSI